MVLLKRLLALPSKIGLDGFLLSLLGMILLARVWPAPGAQEGLISLHTLADIGVTAIFFFYGLRLSPANLVRGLINWRLHIVVQLVTFLLFPIIAITIKYFFDRGGNDQLWLGVIYMAALPGTVSSAIVMVSIAGGNIPGAIFNASLSSILGIFITPLWMGLFLSQQGENGDFTSIITKLILQVLAPVLAGLFMNRYWGTFAERNKRALRLSDQGTILLIIYLAFCEAFIKNMFDGFTLAHLLLLSGAMLVFFFAVCGITISICRMLNFNRGDIITAVFCGSKKSIVHGTVMANIIFVGMSGTGILLLPVMIYHALQLIAASFMAEKWGKDMQK